MNLEEHNAKSASTPKIGLFATLRVLFRGRGSGAPSANVDVRVVRVLRVNVARCALLAVAALSILGLFAASAFAEHALLTSFGSAGSGAGQLALVPTVNGEEKGGSGVAVDDETGDVYVADTGNHRIDEFEANGTFVRAWGWGVVDGLPSFETCTLVCQAGIAGAGPGEFESPTFIAVDNDPSSPSHGDVYVADTGDHLVSKFDPSGGLVESWGDNGPGGTPNGQLNGSPAEPFGSLGGVAVDMSGTLYVNHSSEVFTFEQSGSFVSQFNAQYGGGQVGIAVDAAGNIYLSAGAAVLQYGPSGTQLGQVAYYTSHTTGFAVDPVDDSVYIDQGTLMEHYALDGLGDAFKPGGGLCSLTEACLATDSFGSGQIEAGAGVAVDSAEETVYVADTAAGRIDVFGLVGPLVVSDPASGLTSTGATLNGHVTPTTGGAITSCRFEYVDAADYEAAAADPYGKGQSAPCSPAVPLASPTAVSAHVAGLQLSTVYHFRISATDSKGTNSGFDETFRTGGPEIASESSADVATTSATLKAEVNPFGEPTSYHFEYLTEAEFRADGEGFFGPDRPVVVPQPDAVVGAADEEVEVSQHIQGLSSNTVYHYRVLAIGEFKGEPVVNEGPGQMLTTQGPGGPLALPDGREWELVSPPNKLGAAILPIGGIDAIQASVAGDAITYAATAPIEAQPAGNAFDPQVLSLRGSAGWGSRDIAIPHEGSVIVAEPLEYLLFSEDLSRGIVQPYHGLDRSLSGEASEPTAFVRTDFLGGVDDPCVESCYRPLVTGAPGFANVPAGTQFGVCEGGACSGGTHCPPAYRCGPQFQGATPDLTHVVVRSRAALTKGGSGEQGLYEWSGGKLTFVGVGTVGGEGGFTQETASRHAVSVDGSRVVIRGESEGLRGLLLRDTARGETVQLGGERATLQAASPDESKIFFNDEGALEECEIVEQAGHLHCNRSTLAPGAYVFAPILGASEDGSYVYFVSNSVLTGEEKNPQGEKALPGSCVQQSSSPAQSCNLYVSHNGVSKFIAVLSGTDEPDWGKNLDNYENYNLSNQGFVNKAVLESSARVSSDGRWVVFMSQRSLTGYDNHDAVSGQLDEEVYLYDAAAADGEGKITCASCNPTGARPHGVEGNSLNEGPASQTGGVWSNVWLAASVPGWTTSQYQSRFLGNSGRLFFDSSDALVPQDTNSTEDVYEYEPLGVGGCTESSPTFGGRSDGCVGLISSGASPGQSAFLDASESGGDVFFLTAAQLSPQDADTALDVYDAHVCSVSAPCTEPPGPPPPACVGDACQSPVAAPEDATPGSLTFSGPGDLAPLVPASHTTVRKTTKCSKGKKLEHGRCVKGKAKKKKGAGRSKARRASGGRRTES